MRLLLTVASCALLLTGCGTGPSTPQFLGTVSALFASDPGQGAHKKLEESGRINVGLYDDASKSNGWAVVLDWSMSDVKDSIATYRFNWSYKLDSGEPISGTAVISYDGKNRSEAVLDDQLTIAIDPRSLRSVHPGSPNPSSSLSIWAEDV